MTSRNRVRKGLVSALTGLFALSGVSAEAQAPAGGWSRELEWIKTVPVDTLHPEMVGTAFHVGKHFYLSDGVQGVNVYDVSDPDDPRLINKVNTPGPNFWPSDRVGAYILFGRPNTDGHILLVPGYTEDSNWVPPPHNLFSWPGDPPSFTLYVYDVSDPAREKRLGRLTTRPLKVSGPFCIRNCTWAYDRFGAIVDLRDPTDPKLAGKWSRGLRFNSSSDFKGVGASEIVEVAPGIVLTGTVPMYLLDVRKDPRHPRVLARSDGSPSSRGDIAWPGYPSTDIVLSTNIGGSGPAYRSCAETDAHRGTPNQSSFTSWDAEGWQKTAFMSPAADYFLRNGNYLDGEPPVSGVPTRLYPSGCRINRFDVRKAADGTHLAVVAARAHGIKLLQIERDGKIATEGWFLAHGANAANAFWITDRIVYSIDNYRGIDILEYTGEL